MTSRERGLEKMKRAKAGGGPAHGGAPNKAFISSSTNIYKNAPLAEAIGNIARAGIDCVEIGIPHVPEIERGGAEALAALAKTGTTVYSIHAGLPEHSDFTKANFFKNHHEFYSALFDFGRKCNARVMVVHLNRDELSEWDKHKRQIALNCRQFADWAASYKMIFSVENAWSRGGLPKSPRQFKELLGMAGRENLAVTLDIKHAAMSGAPASRPEDFIREVGRHIVNCHFTELEYPEFEIIELGDWGIPGTGTGTRLTKILESLKKTGYQGAITLELNEYFLRKVLEIVVNVLKRTGVDVKGIEKTLCSRPSLEEKILRYASDFLARSGLLQTKQ